jgi:hypothetical protein
MMTFVRPWWVLGATLASAACVSESPQLVASNCDDPAGCVKQEALHIDAVDILLVIDDSSSMAPANAELKAQLPRMLNAIVTGTDGEMSFPPAKSVHVAVTTTDMGIGSENRWGCTAQGNDGIFVRPGEVGVTCDVSYPGYLAYEGGAAPLVTANTVSCVPLVFSDVTNFGCGFEQPLEASLKAVWPVANPDVTFLAGHGHGMDENSGFLREDSLFIVIIVTDEDDCSTQDQTIFGRYEPSDPSQPGVDVPLNLRCFLNQDKLRDPQRYVDSLKRLRPHNDNVVFAVIGGIPSDLVSDDYRNQFDFSMPDQRAAYLDGILADTRMQEVVMGQDSPGAEHLAPSCTSSVATISPPNTFPTETYHTAQPPRRLVEVVRGFGPQGVLGSMCASDFGSTTGHIIRAVGERLTSVVAH